MEGVCDFEKQDMCNWDSDEYECELRWKLNSGPTRLALSGPEVDHTRSSSNGHSMSFIYTIVFVIYH